MPRSLTFPPRHQTKLAALITLPSFHFSPVGLTWTERFTFPIPLHSPGVNMDREIQISPSTSFPWGYHGLGGSHSPSHFIPVGLAWTGRFTPHPYPPSTSFPGVTMDWEVHIPLPTSFPWGYHGLGGSHSPSHFIPVGLPWTGRFTPHPYPPSTSFPWGYHGLGDSHSSADSDNEEKQRFPQLSLE